MGTWKFTRLLYSLVSVEQTLKEPGLLGSTATLRLPPLLLQLEEPFLGHYPGKKCQPTIILNKWTIDRTEAKRGWQLAQGYSRTNP